MREVQMDIVEYADDMWEEFGIQTLTGVSFKLLEAFKMIVDQLNMMGRDVVTYFNEKHAAKTSMLGADLTSEDNFYVITKKVVEEIQIGVPEVERLNNDHQEVEGHLEDDKERENNQPLGANIALNQDGLNDDEVIINPEGLHEYTTHENEAEEVKEDRIDPGSKPKGKKKEEIHLLYNQEEPGVPGDNLGSPEELGKEAFIYEGKLDIGSGKPAKAGKMGKPMKKAKPLETSQKDVKTLCVGLGQKTLNSEGKGFGGTKEGGNPDPVFQEKKNQMMILNPPEVEDINGDWAIKRVKMRKSNLINRYGLIMEGDWIPYDHFWKGRMKLCKIEPMVATIETVSRFWH
jgi:hypothetical protein